jgi:hypothetical protein
VHGVAREVHAELLTNRSGFRLARIGGADDLAPVHHGVLAAQRREDDGTVRHVTHELTKKRALAMDGVEALGLGSAQPLLAERHDFKPLIDDALKDLGLMFVADRIGLDDAQREFARVFRHKSSSR